MTPLVYFLAGVVVTLIVGILSRAFECPRCGRTAILDEIHKQMSDPVKAERFAQSVGLSTLSPGGEKLLRESFGKPFPASKEFIEDVHVEGAAEVDAAFLAGLEEDLDRRVRESLGVPPIHREDGRE